MKNVWYHHSITLSAFDDEQQQVPVDVEHRVRSANPVGTTECLIFYCPGRAEHSFYEFNDRKNTLDVMAVAMSQTSGMQIAFLNQIFFKSPMDPHCGFSVLHAAVS